jgi:hypothetical protein
VVGNDTGSGDTISVSGGNWAIAVQADNEESAANVGICYYANTTAHASETNVIYFSGSGGSTTVLVEWSEYSGIATSSALDKTASNTTDANTMSTGTTAATTQTGELYIAAMGHLTNGGSVSGWTNGFTETTDTLYTSAVNLGGAMAIKLGRTLETVTTSATLSSGNFHNACVATFKPATDTSATSGYFFATIDDNSNSYDTYRIDRASLAAGTYTKVDDVAVTSRVLPVAWASGLGAAVYTHPAFTTIRYWDQITNSALGYLTAASPTVAPNAGRCVAFHKSRLWVGGSSATPSRLQYSAVGDLFTWTATNFIDVSLDDGEYIEDIVPFEDSLVIAKQTSLWILTGSGPDTFVLKRLPVGGAAPGRTLMPTPYGCIVTGRKHVWLIGGDNTVSLISRPISNSYGMTGNFMTSSYINDVGYICDSATGNVWAVNLQTGTWWEERMPSNEGPSILYNQDFTQLMSPVNSTTGAVLNYRLFPGTARGKDFDTLTETFAQTTPEYWPVGPEYAITPRHLFLRIRQHGGNDSQTGLTITPYYNGVAGTPKTFPPHPTAGVYRERFDLGEKKGIQSIQFALSQTLGTTENSALDIEEATLGYIVEPVR